MKNTKNVNFRKSIYLIKVFDKYLLYSPLAGTSALVNAAALSDLKILFNSEDAGKVSSSVLRLYDDLKPSSAQYPEYSKDSINPGFLGIIPTRDCNGACRYCDFGANHSSNIVLSYAQAIAGVDWYANNLLENSRKLFKVHFFGGEPMIAPDVVEVVIHRARKIASENNLIPGFGISTNGQYSSSWACFLGRYFDTVTLSFDGPEHIHNLHRPTKKGTGSFVCAERTAKEISKLPAQLSLRVCISSKNVDLMEEITEWFCDSFFPSCINFEALKPVKSCAEYGINRPDPYIFARNFIKSRQIAESYGIECVYATDLGDKPVFSSCPVGNDAVIIAPDGQICSCYLQPERWQEFGLDFSVGTVDAEGNIYVDKINMQNIHDFVTDKKRCDRCFCQWNCAGGCFVRGHNNEYDSFCIQSRIITVCSLLESLGFSHLSAKLLSDPVALKEISLQPTDILCDFSSLYKVDSQVD